MRILDPALVPEAARQILEHLGNLVLRVQGTQDAEQQAPTICAVTIEFFNDGQYRIGYSGFANKGLVIGGIEDAKLRFIAALAEAETDQMVSAIVEASKLQKSDIN